MIRSASRADAPWICDIWNDVIVNTRITFTTIRKTVAEIEGMIAKQTVLVLPDAGGFATFGPFRSGPGYAATIEHTILLAAHTRGQGAGARLLTALEECARQDGAHIMVAGISGENRPAIAFHVALGFKQVATMPEVGRKDGQWLDLVLMQKHLNRAATANVRHTDAV